ncbi:hypothetical protein GCK72_025585 [Caenorhabditis remanei]|uniref:Uncharacterized protein n=1 Tax=Caenorhabditis remanei TaxID=31234 RepID=A0A6A5G2E0_CAERE|nr:hypothetical protein GCK72_025585 [Caenorhabditis remanei]KAF1749118.1 hypothetical protein GCK72_025585 [Caenorhabditis remanei]
MAWLVPGGLEREWNLVVHRSQRVRFRQQRMLLGSFSCSRRRKLPEIEITLLLHKIQTYLISSLWTLERGSLPSTVSNCYKLIGAEWTALDSRATSLQLNSVCSFIIMESDSRLLGEWLDGGFESGHFSWEEECGGVELAFRALLDSGDSVHELTSDNVELRGEATNGLSAAFPFSPPSNDPPKLDPAVPAPPAPAAPPAPPAPLLPLNPLDPNLSVADTIFPSADDPCTLIACVGVFPAAATRAAAAAAG